MRMLYPLNLSSHLMEDSIFSDFDRVVNAMVTPKVAKTVGFRPACDIDESEDHYMLSFDMPGVKKEDLKIEVEGNNLIISGERQSTSATYHSEKYYGKFERSFTLPTSINAEKIEAHYEDGVLNIALPKAEHAKPRSIQIQTSGQGLFGKLLGSKKENTREVKDIKVS